MNTWIIDELTITVQETLNASTPLAECIAKQAVLPKPDVKSIMEWEAQTEGEFLGKEGRAHVTKKQLNRMMSVAVQRFNHIRYSLAHRVEDAIEAYPGSKLVGSIVNHVLFDTPICECVGNSVGREPTEAELTAMVTAAQEALERWKKSGVEVSP